MPDIGPLLSNIGRDELHLFETIARSVAAVLTVLFGLITFYFKWQSWRSRSVEQIAMSETSRDAKSGFPIDPTGLFENHAPFPFIPSRLDTRAPDESGWYTHTEVRLWNFGNRIFCGSLVKDSSVAHLSIPSRVEGYSLRSIVSNDPDLEIEIGNPYCSVHAKDERVPIRFGFMRPGKGFMLSLRHNDPDGSGVSIRAFSDTVAHEVIGTHHVMKHSVVRFMGRLTEFAVLPVSGIALFLFYAGDIWVAGASAIFAWLLMRSVIINRSFVESPSNLNCRYGWVVRRWEET